MSTKREEELAGELPQTGRFLVNRMLENRHPRQHTKNHSTMSGEST